MSRCSHKQLGVQCLGEEGHEGDHSLSSEEVHRIIAEGKVLDAEAQITKEDEHRHVTVAQMKRWRQRTLKDLNVLLQAFQRDVITSQVRQNLVWNTMNVFIRVLIKKGIVSEADIHEGGAELMCEANENLEKTKAAVAEKRLVRKDELNEMPMDKMRQLIHPPKAEGEEKKP